LNLPAAGSRRPRFREEAVNYPDSFYYLLFQLAEDLGPATLRPAYRAGTTPAELFAQAGNSAPGTSLPAAAWTQIRTLAGPGRGQRTWAEAEYRWQQMEQAGAQLVGYHHPHYPPLLRELPDAPLQLYTRGRTRCLGEPQLAVVGSRRASIGGRETAARFASELAGCGLVVTSGLALGIDAAAHRAALAAGGETIAVLGTGIDRLYPRAHRRLAEEIAAAGVLVSEFPPGTPPLAANFPIRNRVIAGLCLGTLVVEAARRSGSLITARLALEYNREVFAVPGSIHQPQARGCHDLLRNGAQLVETLADILAPLAGQLQAYVAAPAPAAGGLEPDNPPLHRRVLEAIGFEPTPVDSILHRTGYSPGQLDAVLLELELNGQLELVAGGYQRR
jgi:DNA processing protein